MRKTITYLSLAFSIALLAILSLPNITSAYSSDWKKLADGGYLVDTLGWQESWYEDGIYHWTLTCPADPYNTDCGTYVDYPVCGIPDMPGYEGADQDYYYFKTTLQGDSLFINDDNGVDFMLVSKDWLDAIFPPDTTE